MALVLGLIYVCGMVGMVVADRYRVGLTQRGRLSLATVLTSLPWTLTSEHSARARSTGPSRCCWPRALL